MLVHPPTPTLCALWPRRSKPIVRDRNVLFALERGRSLLIYDPEQENDLVSQQAVVRFGLAHAFPMGSEITFGELAHKVGLGETHIKKLVRHAITQNIFCEPRPGVIAHTACSRLIAEDDVFYSCKYKPYMFSSLVLMSRYRGSSKL